MWAWWMRRSMKRGGDHGVAEDLAPGLEAAVRGDNDRAAFVAARDEREEEVRRLGVRAAGSRSRRRRAGGSARGGAARRRARCGAGRPRGGRPIVGPWRTRRGGR